MLELLEGLEETAETLELGVMARARLLRVGGRMGLSNADRRELYESARMLAEQSADKRLLPQLLWSYGASYYMAGDVLTAQKNIEESVQLVDEIGDTALSSAFRIGSAVVALVTGPLATSLAEAQRSVDLTAGNPEVGQEFLGYSPLVRGTINRSMAHTLMGRLDDARADAEEGLAGARRLAELENLVIGLYAMNLWAFHAGATDDALERARESLDAADLSTRYLHTYAWEGMGMACLLAGDPEEAISALESGAALVAEGVGGFQEANILALLSAAYASVGDPRQAFERGTQAVETARVRGTRVFEGHALLRRAQARELLGQEETLVADDFRLALAAIEETGAYGYSPFIDAARREL
jgi:tetratricopeptide (TPR) repeat protein